MRRALILTSALLLTACAGLQTRSPILTATATCRAYAATLNSLAAFRASGDIDDATADQINDVRAFMTPLCTGEPPTDTVTIEQMEDRLYDLLIAEQEANNE